MTEAELKDLCALWQKRLRLQDWNVSLAVKSAEDMGERFAAIRPDLPSKTAAMNVHRSRVMLVAWKRNSATI